MIDSPAAITARQWGLTSKLDRQMILRTPGDSTPIVGHRGIVEYAQFHYSPIQGCPNGCNPCQNASLPNGSSIPFNEQALVPALLEKPIQFLREIAGLVGFTGTNGDPFTAPREWLEAMNAKIQEANWHLDRQQLKLPTWLHLTRSPERYAELLKDQAPDLPWTGLRNNTWFGITIESQEHWEAQRQTIYDLAYQKYQSERQRSHALRPIIWLSLKPLRSEIDFGDALFTLPIRQIVIGTKAGCPQPDPRWVGKIARQAKAARKSLWIEDGVIAASWLEANIGNLEEWHTRTKVWDRKFPLRHQGPSLLKPNQN